MSLCHHWSPLPKQRLTSCPLPPPVVRCLPRLPARSVWDVRTGGVARSLSSSGGAVTSIEVTPCGRHIVSADGRQVDIRDAATFDLQKSHVCQEYNVESASYAPDKKRWGQGGAGAGGACGRGPKCDLGGDGPLSLSAFYILLCPPVQVDYAAVMWPSSLLPVTSRSPAVVAAAAAAPLQVCVRRQRHVGAPARLRDRAGGGGVQRWVGGWVGGWVAGWGSNALLLADC